MYPFVFCPHCVHCMLTCEWRSACSAESLSQCWVNTNPSLVLWRVKERSFAHGWSSLYCHNTTRAKMLSVCLLLSLQSLSLEKPRPLCPPPSARFRNICPDICPLSAVACSITLLSPWPGLLWLSPAVGLSLLLRKFNRCRVAFNLGDFNVNWNPK